MLLTNLSLGYSNKPLISNVSGEFAQASMTALVGANGAGKSTLLQVLAGLVKPQAGFIECKLKPSYIPQNSHINHDLSITLFTFMSFAFSFWFKPTDEQSRRLLSQLKQVKLEEFAHKPFHTLSGGQQQRAHFARIMLQKPKLMLMDEPFSALDPMTIEQCLMNLQTQAKQGAIVIVALHDYELVRRFFKDTLIITKTGVIWGKTKEVLTPDNLHKAHHV